MKSHNNAGPAPSILNRFLNFQGTFLKRLAWRFGKVNRCEIKGESIVFHKGLFTAETVRASEIKRWFVHPEMGFDIVQIELNNGEVFTWMDDFNDVLTSLRAVAPSKQAPDLEP